MKALKSMWVTNTPDSRPYYITEKPITIKNISLPKGAKIIYQKHHFWQKQEQKRLLNKEDIFEISFKEGTTIDWGGVPIALIAKFSNSKMKGFTLYADFNQLDKKKETQFSNLWQSCGDDLSVTVENTDDWSFNKKNILDIESCSINYQRYYTEDIKQQRFLDDLYSALIKIKD